MNATIVFQKNWEAINLINDGVRKYRYIINEGSSRSSKTYSLIQCYWLYALSNENKRLSVWRDTKKDCKDTVGHDMRQVYPFMPAYYSGCYNKTESIYTLKNNSFIEIRGTDDEEQVMGFNGSAAWINEPYKISRDTFDQIDQRTSDFIIIDWNPKKDHWINDLKKDPRAIVIHSTFRDNPFCPPEQRMKILSYQPIKMCDAVESKLLDHIQAMSYDCEKNEKGLTEKQIKELLRCRDNENKKTANSFNWAVYGLGTKGERPNRIFKWESIPVQKYLDIDATRYIGVDWGSVDPMGILEAKYLDGCLYLHQLNYESENQIREKLTTTERLQVGEATDENEGLIKWLFSKLQISKSVDIICDTNRPLKIALLRRSGYMAFPARKGAGSVIDGIDSLNELKVYYTDTSSDLEYEQENYCRKIDNYGVVMDEPEDINNHLIDPARYICQHLIAKGIIRKL